MLSCPIIPDCRLVQDPADTGEVLCEASLPHLFSDRWQHLAMTFIETVQGKRHAMTVGGKWDSSYALTKAYIIMLSERRWDNTFDR